VLQVTASERAREREMEASMERAPQWVGKKATKSYLWALSGNIFQLKNDFFIKFNSLFAYGQLKVKTLWLNFIAIFFIYVFVNACDVAPICFFSVAQTQMGLIIRIIINILITLKKSAQVMQIYSSRKCFTFNIISVPFYIILLFLLYYFKPNVH
jgi:hypothetical protein